MGEEGKWAYKATVGIAFEVGTTRLPSRVRAVFRGWFQARAGIQRHLSLRMVTSKHTRWEARIPKILSITCCFHHFPSTIVFEVLTVFQW